MWQETSRKVKTNICFEHDDENFETWWMYRYGASYPHTNLNISLYYSHVSIISNYHSWLPSTAFNLTLFYILIVLARMCVLP